MGDEPRSKIPLTDRIIAIGDIHGCSKALAALVEAIQPIEQDTEANEAGVLR